MAGNVLVESKGNRELPFVQDAAGRLETVGLISGQTVKVSGEVVQISGQHVFVENMEDACKCLLKRAGR